MNINIVGAGISGLAAGIYLQRNGFQTQIFEKHDIPGGLCTSWQKGDYTIDGCAHWILGTDKGSSFYKIWNELLDMPLVPFVNHEVKIELQLDNQDRFGSNTFLFYNNLDKLAAYMKNLSPEDTAVVDELMKPIRVFQQFDMPPILDSVSFPKRMIRGIKMSRYLKVLYWFLKVTRYTNLSFAKKFKSPFLREAIEKFYDGEEVNMMVLCMPMAVYDKRSAGYPLGGSLKFAKRLEQVYLQEGGKINYKTPVYELLVENNSVRGVRVRHDVVHLADITLSTADWNWSVFEMLHGKYATKEMIALRDNQKNEVFYSVVQFAFGVKKEYKDWPHFSRFPVKEEIVSPDGNRYSRMELHFYHYDQTVAPSGKTVAIVSFYTKEREYWIELRKTNRAAYREAKQKMLVQVKRELATRVPGILEEIEVEDIATPATVQRYTGSWKGSTQGLLPSKNILAGTPIKFQLPGLQNFYYASHWNQPGGGLPVAAMKAREVAQLICKKYGKKFHGK